MAEGGGGGAAAPTKVRVVRCPKCEKLLPELAGFTVYRCGGCDATLQAKHQIPATDTFSEKSDDERIIISENLERCSGKKGMVSNASSDTYQESDSVEFRRKETGRAGILNGRSTSRSESREVSKEPDIPRFDSLSIGSRSECRDSRYRRPSKAPVDDGNPSVDEMVKTGVEANRENKPQVEATNGSQEVPNTPFCKDEDRDGVGILQRTPRAFLEGIRVSPNADEGPSNGHPSSAYGYRDGDHVRNQNPDGPDRVAYLEQDRVELLRKLDELRDQLSHSCEVTDKPNERAPMNRRAVSSNPYDRHGHGTWFPEGTSSLNRTSVRHFPLPNGHNVDRQSFYPSLHAQNEILGYGEPFGSQPLRNTSCQAPCRYPKRPSENYICGQFDPDPVISYPNDVFYHQPTCSCPHCRNKHWQVPAQAPPSVFCNRRVPYLVNDHGHYPVDNPFMLASASYNHRGRKGSLLSREPRTHQRAVLAGQRGRNCRPIAAGAPFIVCHNCFELLQVPHKHLSVGNNRHKLRCGSCSQVISFELEGQRLIFSSPPPTMNTTLEPRNDAGDAMSEGLLGQGLTNQGLFGSYSGDYDSSGYNVQSTDEKLVLSSPFPTDSNETMEKEYGLNLSESENMQGLSSSSNSSGDDGSLDSIVCQRVVPCSTELPHKAEVNSRGPGLPLREHFGYLASDQAVSRSGKGSRSKRSDQEKVVSTNSDFKQNSVKDVSMATEIDMSVDEYLNPGLSQVSGEVSKEEDQPRMSKGVDSFFTGLIKKSFRDFPRFNQTLENVKTNFSVNGHHVPDRLVKKAEKQAGPVHPGGYWYDYRAGFWGVMGQPCLGIIPPFIEEFNYPMPKNCAGGNTGVTVNGRELHQKDLDLLVGRGLPTFRDRSYIIEISGRVLDEVSGEELDSLGKLAPTIEKVQHGFGMRVPRVHAG